MSERRRPLLVVAGTVAVAGGPSLAGAATWRRLGEPLALGGVGYVRSQTCIRCHAEHHQSWKRTFHRTMTQEATPAAVLGDFDDASLTFDGVTSRFTRAGDSFYIETRAPGGAMQRFSIARTVGSRRVQQYVTKVGDRHLRRRSPGTSKSAAGFI